MIDFISGIGTGIAAGLLVGFLWFPAVTTSNLEHQAIERGYAAYCPDTGNWAWKGECHE